ncbi:TetR/AcrR family transcriptional regulator, partial [Streptomyces sp. NPDC089915]
VTDASLAPVTAAPADALPRTSEFKQSLRSAGSTLLDRAVRAGAVRPDLAPADLLPLMCGIAHAVHVHGGAPDDRIHTARRYLATLLEGLRSTPSHA